ncbi:hypothetical protein [Lysinibacillus sp. SGAir0095]|uniref:hypothetical protein n=1 Tax=Lysinibacillus sp. SGAir0095 TaxID=2070463 RepID=UPI0010CD5051|nr:hypothetical protein [Lysinibacillus sp. SGAir0095]QCR33142.1 hypothetical protein C1N55_13550 [Lysinibacillus sp. SGAir0095]
MGAIDKPKRILACNRQKLLWELHCKEICEDRNGKSNEPCEGCAIYEQLLKIGEVFNATVRERNEEEVS